MKRIVVVLLLIGVLAFTACNKGANAGGAVVTKADTPAATTTAVATGESTPTDATSKPSIITLASGQSVKVIEVAALDTKPEQYAGQIAISGKVEAVFAERQAFTLVDCAKMAGCQDDCCSKTAIPMAVPTEQFEGALPKVDAELVVIGKLTPVATGYSFEVLEVREGETPILTRKDVPSSGA